jgi:Tfp pilus assembly protein FimT
LRNAACSSSRRAASRARAVSKRRKRSRSVAVMTAATGAPRHSTMSRVASRCTSSSSWSQWSWAAAASTVLVVGSAIDQLLAVAALERLYAMTGDA